MRKLLFALVILGTTAGCQPANISAVMRASDRENASMETRCVAADMRDDDSDLAETFSKFDGWRLIYISEYTTSNKTGTSGVVCFERGKQ